MSLKLIGGNPNAIPDTEVEHKKRMLQENCPHDTIVVHNKTGIHCNACGILCSLVFQKDPDEASDNDRIFTIWIGEIEEREKDDVHDPA